MNPKYFTDDPELTKFGYFQAEDFKSLSKFETWQYAVKNGIPNDKIKFNFNDDYFSSLDWKNEPDIDINQLYKKRAQQLREKYDHIVLLYSGGIDSHVALHSFVDNGLKIDEILSCCNLSYLPKSAKFNQEIFNVAVPHVEQLNLQDTKFNLVDIGDIMLKVCANDDYLDTFLYLNNGPLSAWSMVIRSGYFKLMQEAHIKLASEGKTICYLWGLDKPTIKYENGKYVYRNTNVAPDFAQRNFFSKYMLPEKLKNFTDEAFFICSEFPQIAIKQSHLLVNHMNKIQYDHPSLITTYRLANTGPYVEHRSSFYAKNGKWLAKQEIEKIIYPGVEMSFGDDKLSGSVIFSPRDSWFYRMKCESRDKYIAKVKSLLRDNENYFKYTYEGTPVNGFTVFGKSYGLS